MRPTIIVFAKAPVIGRVKTRLGLDPAMAAAFHEEFVRRTLTTVLNLRDVADAELHTDVETLAWDSIDIKRSLQAAGDLGTRMLAALTSRAGPVMIAGSDAPTLPELYLRGILASEADVTFGPCEDGGYYAVFCRKTHPGMFTGVEWSTPGALLQSEEAARACGLSVARGEEWFDVDTLADLVRAIAGLH